ncbi:protoheme IX farnesyltransferase [Chloroflexota bacterium]
MLKQINLKKIPLYSYVEVLKPRESFLLIFIGMCGAIVAGNGWMPAGRLFLLLAALTMGCEGCNGLTNYMDRKIDGLMSRTCSRSLPSRRIAPPQKVLPLVLGLLGAGLILAWLLNPLCFVAGVTGTLAAILWRKTAWTHLLGCVSGVAPFALGWFAVKPQFDIMFLLISLLIGFWVPLHVWSVMVAHKQEYIRAGITFFPISWQEKNVVKIFFVLSLVLYGLSLAVFYVGSLSWIYLVTASFLGILMVSANWRLVRSAASRDAWKVYKLTAFPYLGIIFLAIALDILL